MRVLILLLGAVLAPFQDHGTRPSERLTLEEAIARAAPGDTIDARLFSFPHGAALVLDRSLTLVHARLPIPIVIDEPADKPVLVRLVDVEVLIDAPRVWWGAVESLDPFSTLELLGCTVRTAGHYAVVNPGGPVRVRSSFIEARDPSLGVALGADRAVVVRSTCAAVGPGGWAVSASSLVARESLFLGKVGAAELDLERGGHSR